VGTRISEFVAAVRKHAEANYDKGGWDVLVECMDDQEIAKWIGRARTVKGAVRNVWQLISVYAERQADGASYAENW